ncbi:MAG: serine hydrolase, partial [Vicinamibacteria bacterium]
PETVRLMTENQIADLDFDDGMRFGLGLSIKSAADETGGRGTFGWAGFFHTLFWVDPENDLIGVFLSQVRLPEGESVASDFNRAVYRSLEHP